jgi:hypothetical protein
VPFVRRLLHYGLGRLLTLVTGRLVTDPTSGLWAFGPDAIDLLAEHHPSGYPEPELNLLLSRTRLRVVEVPVVMRERLAGRTSLTLRRTLTAVARLLFYLVVVPLGTTTRGRQRRQIERIIEDAALLDAELRELRDEQRASFVDIDGGRLDGRAEPQVPPS